MSKVLHRAEERYPRIEKLAFYPGCFGAKAKALLPSPCNTSIDQVSHEESIAEARPLGQASELGNRARVI
jgi:hypothetical protein